MTFTGFPPDTTDFLADLSAHNSKAWFDANRHRYERGYVEPAKAFVEAVTEPLRQVAPVEAEPRINGSIFRINRDIRFSKDKTPYKDHLDLWFWEGERKGALSGFFLRITAETVGIGVGAHGFDRDRLAAFRSAVVDGSSGPSLRRTIEEVERTGHSVKGEHYQRVPRGFEAADPFQERLLRHAALWTSHEVEHPDELTSAAIIDWALDHWRSMAPVHRWLVDTL